MKKHLLFLAFAFCLCVAQSDAKTVYFDNFKSEWETVRIHYWGNSYGTNWPGEQLTPGENGIYTAEIPDDVNGFIFNNGNGKQTKDLTDANRIYYFDKSDDSQQDVSFPLNVYMIGSIKIYGAEEEHNWDEKWDGAKLTYNGQGIYNIEMIELLPSADLSEGENERAKFRFITNPTGGWNNHGEIFVPENDDNIKVGAPSKVKSVYNSSISGGWTIKTSRNNESAPYDTYDFNLNLNARELSIKTSTGVETIEIDNTPAEYYNLQGVKVENPACGLYIVRKGNKVSKQYIR